MNTSPLSRDGALSTFEQLRMAQDVLRAESQAVGRLAKCLDPRFTAAVSLLVECTGAVIVAGIGKAGLVGQKIAATLASTGTPSHFLHPTEAVHGDLGKVRSTDVVLILSQSGETEEVVELLPPLAAIGVPVIAVTARESSRLGRSATVVLELGRIEEACPLGFAPTTSTTVMLALGDALALVASRVRGFRREDFARLHPGGSLGLRLAFVENCMRPLDECRVAREDRSIREVLVEVSRPGRRVGAIMLTNSDGRLTGLFTDSDLARLFEQRRDSALDEPAWEVMTRSPITVQAGTGMQEAVAVLADRKISELPVIDARGAPIGLLDITDVVGGYSGPSADNS
jgi:arabinose-5-phosphate isomerase